MEKKSNTNSLDWDSPSTKTGTVKRRPVSGLSDASSGSESRKKTGDSECEKNAGISSVNSDCGCFAKDSMDFIVRAFDCRSAVNVDNTGNCIRRTGTDCRDIQTWNSDINAKETFVTECLEKLRKYERKYSDHVLPENHEFVRDRNVKIRNSDSGTVKPSTTKPNRNMSDSKIRGTQLVVRNEPKSEHRLRNSVPSASRDSSNSRIRNSVPSGSRDLKVRDYPREHSSSKKVPRTAESNIPDLIGAATRICEARTVCLANGRPRSGPSKHVPGEPETLSRSSVLQENYETISTANGKSKRSPQVTQDTDKCLQQRHTQGTKSNHCNCGNCTPSVLVPVSLKTGKMSDSDSGIASPLSPLSVYAYTGSFRDVFFTNCDGKQTGNTEEATWRHLEQLRSCTCLTDQQQIYTDWANHYLEKGRSKRRISSLATDCSDGVLLADVIESVTNQKIPDITRKPKTPTQMLDNINACLAVLRAQHVPGIEGVSSTELREGRLKAVLALFFALSRYKQATKQQQQQQRVHQQQQQQDMTPNRQVTGVHNKGSTNIPLPGSALPARRCPPDKVRPVAGSSRASSPGLSMIPRAPPTAAVNSPYQASPQQKNSMLDKLKLFKNNGTERPTPPPTASSGKRTSSSSGVSSARSERSDSSVSLEPASDLKPTRNIRLKQQRPTKTTPAKHSPNASKKETSSAGSKPTKIANDIEKHANKVANLGVSKANETKLKAPTSNKINSNLQHHQSHHQPQQQHAQQHHHQQQQQQQQQQQTQVAQVCPTQFDQHGRPVPVQNQTGSMLPGPGTGIPKPTAAIKGTSKTPIKEERPPHPLPTPLKSSPQVNTNVVAPMSREGSQVGLTVGPKQQAVAMVSPMPSDAHSLLSESSHSASTGQHSNSSESSVIYKPSSESGSEHPIPVIPNRKETQGYLSEATEQLPPPPPPPAPQELPPKQPEKPLHHLKNHLKEGIHVRDGSQEEEPTSMNVQPMRPLLRGYCSNLTLPARGPRGHYPQRVQPDGGSDYCEISIANGYLSDGEVLRNPIVRNEICDGYMSEGGTLYARRLQTMPTHLRNGTARVGGTGLTVLTEQTGRRARVEENPPPTGPRPGSRTRNGQQQPPPGSGDSSKHGGQWKRYTDSPGVGSPPPPAPAPASPTSSRRERRSSPHGMSKEAKSSSKVRGVPQSFGYVKRNSASNGTVVSPQPGGPGQPGNNKTAQVSAVPRTKVKVSGGTQTCSSDLQPHKANPQYKSYSLTGNAASQLSQSVRERLLMGSQSLPKSAGQEYGLVLRQNRPKASDGSLSDTQAADPNSPYAPWLRHSNTYSVAPRLTETDSMESLSSLPGHRSSLTHARLLRDSPSRLSRSNSIRSTKSEKLYPSMLHRNAETESEPYYCLPVGSILSHWSQPTSPAPGNARTFPLSPTHSTPRHSLPKNDDVHGSSVSLVSTASSLYSSAEEKQAHEIRKLRRELMDAQEKVHTLTSQLSTNAHVVSAFEQSLTSMTQRLQHLTATAERKDNELSELRTAMENLRTQSVQAGLTPGLARQPSSDSVSSLSSACSLDKQEKKKKKGWLRSSFTKAFSRNAKITKVQSQSEGESERPSSPPAPAPTVEGNTEVAELQKQLREKDLVLTDIRLEALSSAHQLESLKDTVMKMRNEMLSLKQNNERLQRMVGGTITVDCTDRSVDSTVPDVLTSEELPPEVEPDGKRITISVYLGQPQCFDRYYSEHYGSDGDATGATGEVAIAHTSIGASTSWQQLDSIVRRSFKQHVARLDPGGGLGLGGDAVASYRLGEAERGPDLPPPDLLPVGYAVGCVATLHVVLQPVAALAFEALIPRGVAQRLVSLLAEHRRLVLCGAPGTGKSHLAARLAEFHAQSLGRDPAEAVATFNVDNKSAKELRQYLTHLGEQAAAGGDNGGVLPCVVVLDNLHRAGPLAEALGSLPRNLPCLLGTMAQAACSATSLQLQHGFRWVLVAPHMEPARGLLGRVLRRRLASLELDQGRPQPELASVLGWLPRVWQHLNTFLETHSSGDVAIGPRLFLSCPLELDSARAWFSDVWNYSLAPYLREAAREGLQLYGRRAAWTDPTQFVLDTYPWPGAPPQGLTRISPRDVGLETGPTAQADNDGDPLLSMLMRLQEAANYSSPHSNDSDCASLDSNLTHESSLGTESVL